MTQQKLDPRREKFFLEFWTQALRRIVELYRLGESTFQDVRRLTKQDPERARRMSDLLGELQWWRYYEMKEWQLLLKAGIDVQIFQSIASVALRSGVNAALSAVFKKGLEDIEFEPKSPQRAVSAAHAVTHVIQSYVAHGVSLNELVRRSAKDEKSLKKALRIDPMVIYCAPVRARIARAALERDQKFFERLGDAFLIPKEVKSVQYIELEICLQVMHAGKGLNRLTQKMAYDLFSERLGIYPKVTEGSTGDPPRSLWKLIERFKKDHAT